MFYVLAQVIYLLTFTLKVVDFFIKNKYYFTRLHLFVTKTSLRCHEKKVTLYFVGYFSVQYNT